MSVATATHNLVATPEAQRRLKDVWHETFRYFKGAQTSYLKSNLTFFRIFKTFYHVFKIQVYIKLVIV